MGIFSFKFVKEGKKEVALTPKPSRLRQSSEEFPMRYHLPAPPAQGQKETLRLLQLSGGGSQRSQRAAELELGRAKDRGLKLSKAAPRGEPAKRGRLGVRNPDIAVSRVGEGEEHKAPSVASTSSGSDCWIPNYTAKPNPHTNEEEHRTLYNGPAGLRRLETFVQETVPFRPPPEPARQPCPLVMGTHDTSVLGPCRCYQDEGALPPRPPTRRRVLPDERPQGTGKMMTCTPALMPKIAAPGSHCNVMLLQAATRSRRYIDEITSPLSVC